VSAPTAGGVTKAYRAERRKLYSQLSTRVLALVCGLGPLAFGAVLSGQSGVPGDTLLGGWVHSSGYAFSLVVLGFAGYLGFPLVAGALAGDIFSSEDRYGTWKTILTRSGSRGEVFAGKVLAAGTLACALLALATVSSLIAGLLFIGGQSMVGLGGAVVGSGEALLLVLASWLLNLPGLLGFAALALLLSAATRNGIVGVLGPLLAGLLMQLLALVGSGTWMHFLLLSSTFDDWHGLLSSPRFYSALIVGNIVALAWTAVCLWVTWWVLRRREFAGPPLSRRAGWIAPARVVLVASGVVVLLAALGNVGPTGLTSQRLEASMGRVFERLTLLQQRELGRSVPADAKLNLRTKCQRHSGQTSGPGDDWTCAMTVVSPLAGYEPYQLTAVTYDVSVKSNGCYKAEAPPTFVGQQTMVDAEHHSVVNPLFIIYGCFDTTGRTPRCAEGAGCGEPGSGGTPVNGSGAPAKAPSAREKASTRQAEQSSGGVVRETEKSERELEQSAKGKKSSEESTQLNLGR
jgi:ABC-2 type transport system permease protein